LVISTFAVPGWWWKVDHGTRDELLSRLAEAVGSVIISHPTRVATDGPPAAGKTTLADELAIVLRRQGRDVIRATIEDFLTPASQRFRSSKYSAEGVYHDGTGPTRARSDRACSKSVRTSARVYRPMSPSTGLSAE